MKRSSFFALQIQAGKHLLEVTHQRKFWLTQSNNCQDKRSLDSVSMLWPHFLAPIPELRPEDATLPGTFENRIVLNVGELESDCDLMGATTAWVTRHTEGNFQTLMLVGDTQRVDPAMNQVQAYSEQNSQLWQVLVVSWNCDTLLCASLSANKEVDGCTYMLGMVFAGKFELTKRLAAVVDSLRCSLQVLIKRKTIRQRGHRLER